MKNKSLIPNIAVLLVVALVCVLTGQIYLQQQKDDVLYTENPDITGVIRLSDYNPNLKDTPGDVDIYVFDSGIPGGKALIYGGTHTNEVGSMLNAVTYLENVKCEEGTLYVMVRANNSGYSHTQPLLAQLPAEYLQAGTAPRRDRGDPQPEPQPPRTGGGLPHRDGVLRHLQLYPDRADRLHL